MEFGLFYQLPCGPDQSAAQRYDDMIAEAQVADRLGFDSIWLAELHFNARFSVMPSPLLAAAAIARTTSNIKIGTAVNLVSLHHPVRLAEETATLDILSRGRAIFGIGRGSNANHFEGYGIDQTEGRESFREAVDFILKAWTSEELTYKGQYYQAKGLSVVPKPYQKPHPPVYVASNSADTFELVGSMGHNILVGPLIATTEGVQSGLRRYRTELTNQGYDPAGTRVNLALPTHVAPDASRGYSEMRPTIDAYLNTLRSTSGRRGSSRADVLNYDIVYEEYGIIGDPQRCVDRLRYFVDLMDPQEIMCWFNMGGTLSFDEVTASMELFAQEVMPHFQ